MAELIRRCRPLLGTFVEVESDREAAIEAAFEAIARVHKLMSAHEPDSDVSRVNRFAHLGPVLVDEWTACVLERAIFWSKHSEGSFDIVRAGKHAIGSGYLPRHVGQPAPEASHWTWLELEGCTVRLMRPACIDLGGIAKGFAIDKAIEAMRAAGASQGIVNAGGDLATYGGEPLPVSIVDALSRRPIIEVQMADAALATSAVQPDGDGRHLPDLQPGTVNSSVRAPRAIDADALTKILIAGSQSATQCLRIADAEGLVVSADGSIRTFESLAA